MTATRLFGYSAVITYMMTVIFAFILLVMGEGTNAIAIAFIGGILATIQAVLWAMNK